MPTLKRTKDVGMSVAQTIVNAVDGRASLDFCVGVSCNSDNCPFNKTVSDGCDITAIKDGTADPTPEQMHILLQILVNNEYTWEN